MELKLNENIARDYKSASQKARVLTEQWVDDSVYCPNCGKNYIDKYPNNQPVADFFCVNCHEDYELKSKQNNVGTKIVDGAYRTMIERLTSSTNPNFFLLNYDLSKLEIINFMVIPKHFFIPQIIEKRKPLAPTASRSGWVGCNIILKNIPQTGRIYLVRNKVIKPKEKVLSEWKKTLFLRDTEEVLERGWLLDVIYCIEKIGKKDFTLNEVYGFEKELSKLHPNNKHIKDKIRQQLQFLRDKGYLDFVSRGYYQLA
ncbi:restriction endonuclease [Patescibacteria group bacterium]|nr:restriction endonuclease [Patescibacteria group bacterium]MBU1951962.1 restriction endonuclease [Patescibacteria group bacterium]MBU2229206.1 restriction endonuclease [Patescibacteria group bacterium]